MKKFYLVFILQFFIAQFVLTAYCQENSLLTIEVRPLSLVEHKKIHLGDIAWITGDDPRLVKFAQSIMLTSAPVRNRSRLIKKSLIIRSLSKNSFDLKEVTLDIPDKITVKNKLTRISEDDVRETVREYIYENMPWDKDQVDITEIALRGDILLPPGELHQNITMAKDSNFIGKVYFDLEFTLNGKIFKRRKAMANIKVLMPEILTKVSLKKDQVISKNDIYVENQWRSKIPLKVYTSIDEAIGKSLIRNIKAGQPLKKSFLKVPNDISKGDRLTIIARIKTLRITAPGIAGENGKAGEIIQVKNLNSKKTIYARVINNTTVKIDL